MSTHAREQLGFEVRTVTWSSSTSLWMGVAFLVALGLAGTVLATFSAEDRGTEIALRVTARWSFLLFWCAYAGGAIAKLFGQRFGLLGRYGRNFGLAFASAQLVHVGLIVWLYHISSGPAGAMTIFWLGIFFTYLLALFSWPRVREMVGPLVWRVLLTIALECIAYVFALDFIQIPLVEHGLSKYPPSYLPFTLMLVGGFGLRVAALIKRIYGATGPGGIRNL